TITGHKRGDGPWNHSMYDWDRNKADQQSQDDSHPPGNGESVPRSGFSRNFRFSSHQPETIYPFLGTPVNIPGRAQGSGQSPDYANASPKCGSRPSHPSLSGTIRYQRLVSER